MDVCLCCSCLSSPCFPSRVRSFVRCGLFRSPPVPPVCDPRGKNGGGGETAQSDDNVQFFMGGAHWLENTLVKYMRYSTCTMSRHVFCLFHPSQRKKNLVPPTLSFTCLPMYARTHSTFSHTCQIGCQQLISLLPSCHCMMAMPPCARTPPFWAWEANKDLHSLSQGREGWEGGPFCSTPFLWRPLPPTSERRVELTHVGGGRVSKESRPFSSSLLLLLSGTKGGEGGDGREKGGISKLSTLLLHFFILFLSNHH